MVTDEITGFRSLVLTGVLGMLLSVGCVAVSPESDSDAGAEQEPGVESRENTKPGEQEGAAEHENERAQASREEGASSPAAVEPEKAEARASRETKHSTPAPPPPREPAFTDVTLSAGTLLDLELLTPLDSSRNSVGDEVRARTLYPIEADGRRVLEAGAEVVGRVTEVEASGKVKGRAKLAFAFDRMTTSAGAVDIRTSFVSLEAESGKKKDAAVIGGAAGVGAIVGGIIGGKKGAAIGASIGGAGGTGVVLSTKGEEIRLEQGVELQVRLDAPVTVRITES